MLRCSCSGASQRTTAAPRSCCNLENLHWADNESLDFLNPHCELSRDVPLLLLTFTRSTLFERWADWRSTDGVHRRIDLAALGQVDSHGPTRELLKNLHEVPTALEALCARSAQGTPFLFAGDPDPVLG